VFFGEPGNYSWTCPAGVFDLVNFEVAGGLYFSNPDSYEFATAYALYAASTSSPGGSSSDFFTYNQAGSYSDSVLGQFNSGGTGERNISFTPIINYWNPVTSLGTTVLEDSVTYRIRGVASTFSGPWSNRTNQPARGINEGWYISFDVFVPGSSGNGTASSALGWTAAGATAPNQQTVIVLPFLTVTPGQTYNIIVGSPGGYVVLQFEQS
jgi:hypothetical protein